MGGEKNHALQEQALSGQALTTCFFLFTLSFYPQAGTSQEIPWCADPHAINLAFKNDTKIADIQGQKRVAPGRKRGNQHWFIFGSRQEQRALCGEGIGHPLDTGLQILPMCGGLWRELGEVFYGLGAAISGGDQVPTALGGENRDESRERSF